MHSSYCTLYRTAEHRRLEDDAWRQWGPYLSERQWGTVREDHSCDGNWSVLLSILHCASTITVQIALFMRLELMTTELLTIMFECIGNTSAIFNSNNNKKKKKKKIIIIT